MRWCQLSDGAVSVERWCQPSDGVHTHCRRTIAPSSRCTSTAAKRMVAAGPTTKSQSHRGSRVAIGISPIPSCASHCVTRIDSGNPSAASCSRQQSLS
eukprot:COSAG01_NODE_698_length_14177_cov_13.550039_11_plen_98_part_00